MASTGDALSPTAIVGALSAFAVVTAAALGLAAYALADALSQPAAPPGYTAGAGITMGAGNRVQLRAVPQHALMSNWTSSTAPTTPLGAIEPGALLAGHRIPLGIGAPGQVLGAASGLPRWMDAGGDHDYPPVTLTGNDAVSGTGCFQGITLNRTTTQMVLLRTSVQPQPNGSAIWTGTILIKMVSESHTTQNVGQIDLTPHLGANIVPAIEQTDFAASLSLYVGSGDVTSWLLCNMPSYSKGVVSFGTHAKIAVSTQFRVAMDVSFHVIDQN